MKTEAEIKEALRIFKTSVDNYPPKKEETEMAARIVANVFEWVLDIKNDLTEQLDVAMASLNEMINEGKEK